MGSVINVIQEQIYKTIVLCVDFFKLFNIWIAIGTLAFLYFFVMRTWDFRKIFSLFITWFVLLIAYVRIEAFFLTAPFSPEGIEMAQILTRIISGIVAAIIFVYHIAIAQ